MSHLFISYERREEEKEHTKTNLRFIFRVANMAVMAKMTSTAIVTVTSDGKGDVYNSDSDRQRQR